MKTESHVVRFHNPNKTSIQVRQFQDVTESSSNNQEKMPGWLDCTRFLCVLRGQCQTCQTFHSDVGPLPLVQFILLIWFGLLMYTRRQLLTFLISILRASFWFRNELLHLLCGTKYPTETLPSEWSLVQKSSKRQDSTQDSWKAVRRVVTFTQRKCGKCGNPQEFGTRPKSAQGLKFFEFKGESSKSDDEVYTWGLILSSWQHTLCFLLLNLNCLHYECLIIWFSLTSVSRHWDLHFFGAAHWRVGRNSCSRAPKKGPWRAEEGW